MTACLVAVTLATMLPTGKPAPPLPWRVFIGPGVQYGANAIEPWRSDARSVIKTTTGTVFVRETTEEIDAKPCLARPSKPPD